MSRRTIPNCALALAALLAAPPMPAQSRAPDAAQRDLAAGAVKGLHIIGMEATKLKAQGKLAVRDGAMQFTAGELQTAVRIASIDDIFTGEETTQAGGKLGTMAKTAAMAAPYESGKALSLLLRTKVDILTVAYRGADGELRGAIFALPKGEAAQVRAQLIAAGAHASAPPADQEQKARRKQ
jgi:hypothetical protein